MYNPNLENINPLTYEAFIKENLRWESLTPEQQQAEYNAICGERDRLFEETQKKCREEKEKKQEEFIRQAYITNRKPNSLDNNEAIILWLTAIGVGAIFNARWLIWIIATIMLFLHFTREKRREINWDNNIKEKYCNNTENILKNGGKE